MAEVTELKIAPNEPDTEIVRLLQGLLRDAKEGKLLNFACAYVLSNNGYNYNFVAKRDQIGLIGATTVMKAELIEQKLTFDMLAAEEDTDPTDI